MAKKSKFEFSLENGSYCVQLGESFAQKDVLKKAGMKLDVKARAWTAVATDKCREKLEKGGGKFVGTETKSKNVAPILGHKEFQPTLAAYVEAKLRQKEWSEKLESLKADVSVYVLEHGDLNEKGNFVVEVGYDKCMVSERSREFIDAKTFHALVAQGKISKEIADACTKTTVWAQLNHWDKSPLVCPECQKKQSKKSAKFCNECGHKF